MPAKLKGLKVTKVDFVDAGDNKRADVLLFKHTCSLRRAQRSSEVYGSGRALALLLMAAEISPSTLRQIWKPRTFTMVPRSILTRNK